MFSNRDKAQKKKRIRIYEATRENDIRYKGPLNSQHFKILGWLCIALSQLAVIIQLGSRFSQEFAADTEGWLSAFQSISDLSLPFLLIAVFAQLLGAHEGYRRTLLVNSSAMAGVFAAFCLVFYRYIVGSIASFLTDPSEALPGISGFLHIVAPYGFFTFNIFVDLFLCTLTVLFLNYNPRRVFTGKSRIIFRLFALLPIGYEVGCMLLKVRSARGLVQIPVWAWPLLTVKPPMTFVLFVILTIFIKTREMRFRRHGRTREEYQDFLKSRRNSLNFSVFLALMMVLVSLADLAVVAVFSLNEASGSLAEEVRASVIETLTEKGQEVPEDIDARIRKVMESYETPTVSPEAVETPAPAAAAQAVPEEVNTALEKAQASPDVTQAPVSIENTVRETLDRLHLEGSINSSLYSGMRIAEAVGFGDSSILIILAPLVLLFSYTARPKYRLPGILIPTMGILLILIVYVEGIHQLLPLLPLRKMDLQKMKEIFYLSISTLL